MRTHPADKVKFSDIPPGFEGPAPGFGGQEVERDENGYRLNNNADISGLVDDDTRDGEMPSDYINRQRGAALEGEITEHTPPIFARLSVAQDSDEPEEETGTIYFAPVGEPQYQDRIPGDCPAGWVSDLSDVWYPVDTIKHMLIDGHEVKAYLNDEKWILLAQFDSLDDAREFRRLIAERVAWSRGLVAAE